MPDISQLQTRIASALGIAYDEAGKLATRMAPVIIIDNIDGIGEGADTGVRWCMQTGSAAGAGAILAQVALSNIGGSGIRITLDGAVFTSNTTGGIRGGFRAFTTLTTAIQGVYRDGGPGPFPVGIIHEGDLAAGPNVEFSLNVIADQGVYVPLNLVIQPGQQWAANCNTTARSLLMTYFWKEIKLPRIS